MGEFIFIRHGQSEANANGTIATAKTKLTQIGIEQARETAENLKRQGITKVFCSPMLRAQQTAEIISGELGIDIAYIVILDELRERAFGELEGKPKSHETSWYYLSNDEPTSEKTQDLFERMSRCLVKIQKLSGLEKALVVGHGSSGFYLLQIAAGKRSIESFDPVSQMNNAGFTVVKFDKSHNF